MSAEDTEFDVTVPSSSDSALDPVVFILDRKAAPGRVPKHVDSLLFLPANYFVVRKSGNCEWLHQRKQRAPAERKLLFKFERLYPRDKERRCDPVHNYPEVTTEMDVDTAVGDPGSPAEMQFSDDTYWEFDLHQYFSDVYGK